MCLLQRLVRATKADRLLPGHPFQRIDFGVAWFLITFFVLFACHDNTKAEQLLYFYDVLHEQQARGASERMRCCWAWVKRCIIRFLSERAGVSRRLSIRSPIGPGNPCLAARLALSTPLKYLATAGQRFRCQGDTIQAWRG